MVDPLGPVSDGFIKIPGYTTYLMLDADIDFYLHVTGLGCAKKGLRKVLRFWIRWRMH
jgi:hypothetical protein